MRKAIVFIRKVDKIGRLVISKDIRSMYGIEDEDNVYIVPAEDGILIRKAEPVDLI